MPANPTPAEGVVAPIYPTEAMLDAAHEVPVMTFEGEPVYTTSREAEAIYLAMLAARPAAPTQSAAQTGEVERLRYALENTAARWLALDTDETEEAVRGYARKSVREIKAALSQREPGQ